MRNRNPIQFMINHHLVGGWALPLWKMIEFVNWDDDIPDWMESHNPVMFQTTNQWLLTIIDHYINHD